MENTMRCYRCNKEAGSMWSEDGVEWCDECFSTYYQDCDACGYSRMTMPAGDENYCVRCYDEYSMMRKRGK